MPYNNDTYLNGLSSLFMKLSLLFDEFIVLCFCEFVNIKIENLLKNIKLSEIYMKLGKVKSERPVSIDFLR